MPTGALDFLFKCSAINEDLHYHQKMMDYFRFYFFALRTDINQSLHIIFPLDEAAMQSQMFVLVRVQRAYEQPSNVRRQ